MKIICICDKNTLEYDRFFELYKIKLKVIIKEIYIEDFNKNIIECNKGDIVLLNLIHKSKNSIEEIYLLYLNKIKKISEEKKCFIIPNIDENIKSEKIVFNEYDKIKSEKIYNLFKKILSKSIYVIGRAKYYENNIYEKLFSNISFTNCTCIHHLKDEKYKCFISHKFFTNKFINLHNKKCTHIYIPFSIKGNSIIDNFEKLDNIKIVRDYDYKHMGKMTTGMMSLIVFSKIYENIYISGFSHFDSKGNPKIPDKDMKNAYDNKGSKLHSYKFEYYLAKKLYDEYINIYVI